MEGGIRDCWFYVPDFASSYFLMLLLMLLLLSNFEFHIYILLVLFLSSKSIFHHDNSTPFSFSISYYFLDCYGNRLKRERKRVLRFFVVYLFAFVKSRSLFVFLHGNNLGTILGFEGLNI